MRATLACLAVLLSGCSSVATPPATVAPTPTAPPVLLQAPTEACGTVQAWSPPTATQAGSITLGSKTYSVNAGTNHGATGFAVTTGAVMCLFGGLDGQRQPYHGASRVESPFCGAVLAFTPATSGATGSVTLLHFGSVTLAIAAGAELGLPPLGVRRCVTTHVNASGDVEAPGHAAPSIHDMEQGLWCGAVKSYAAGSSIAIGSRRWEIAGATAYDTAGPNGPDRTTGGTPMCLTAALDDAGRITRYVTNDMPASETGLVTSYTAATATSTGTVVFSYKYVRPIAAGVTLDGVTVGARVCVKLGLDAAGDRVITGGTVCGGVGF